MSEHEHDVRERHHKKTAHKRRLFKWSSIISKFLAENLEYYTDLKRKIRRFQKLYYGSGKNDDEENLI